MYKTKPTDSRPIHENTVGPRGKLSMTDSHPILQDKGERGHKERWQWIVWRGAEVAKTWRKQIVSDE